LLKNMGSRGARWGVIWARKGTTFARFSLNSFCHFDISHTCPTLIYPTTPSHLPGTQALTWVLDVGGVGECGREISTGKVKSIVEERQEHKHVTHTLETIYLTVLFQSITTTHRIPSPCRYNGTTCGDKEWTCSCLIRMKTIRNKIGACTQFDTFTSKEETVLGHHHTTHHALESTPFDHPPT
jgi:ferredoxin-thioredoxin reductase catalytic subunit